MGLLQTYHMVLFSPPAKVSEDAQVEQVLQIIDVLKGFDPSVYPAFEKAKTKKQVISFDYSADRVRELIRKNVNREGKTSYPELGTGFGFFSSMDNDRMAGISFRVGAQKWPGSNNFIFEFPIKPSVLDQEAPFTPKQVWDLFIQCSSAFHPQRGSVLNSVNHRRFWDIKQAPHDPRPVTVDWMNYFTPVVLDAIGRKRFEALPNVHLEDFQGGLLLRLLDTPLDDSNPEHLNCQKEINRRLGLPGA